MGPHDLPFGPRAHLQTQTSYSPTERPCCCRLDSAPSNLDRAATSKTSALLGVLIQHDSPAKFEASISAGNENQGAAARHALGPQSKVLAPEGPTVAQQHRSASTAPLPPADAPGHQSSAECPLCGCSVPVRHLEAHVDAELQELDAAAHSAPHPQSAATARRPQQAPHPTTAKLSRRVQDTVDLLSRQPRRVGDVGHVLSDHSSQGAGRALWPEEATSGQNTLYGISISGMQPAAQQATAAPAAARGIPSSIPPPGWSCPPLHQAQRRAGTSMQCSRSAAAAACESAAAQQGRCAHKAVQSSGTQPHPRPRVEQKRQWQGQGEPRELCRRGPVQQRPGAASHRQLPGKRKPQAHPCCHRIMCPALPLL